METLNHIPELPGSSGERLDNFPLPCLGFTFSEAQSTRPRCTSFFGSTGVCCWGAERPQWGSWSEDPLSTAPSLWEDNIQHQDHSPRCRGSPEVPLHMITFLSSFLDVGTERKGTSQPDLSRTRTLFEPYKPEPLIGKGNGNREPLLGPLQMTQQRQD